jgi:hypothetical protein
LSLALAVFCALPYVHWFVTHAGEATSSVHKLHMSTEIGALMGLWDLLRAMGSHLMPLVLIYLILFPAGFLPRNRSPKHAAPSISLGVYLVILFALLLTMVFLFHVTAFRTRWMQPLLFVGPIFFFLGLKEEVVRPGARKCFFWVTGTVAVVVLCVVALQVWGAYLFGRYTYLNYPYREMAQDLRTLGFHDGVIVGDRRISAGSLRIQFPASIALDPELLLSNPYKELKNRDVLVFWDSERSQIPPESLRDYLKNALGIELSDKAITYVKAKYLCSDTRYARAGIIIVPGREREFVKKVGERNG